ncbi:hypothetical protein SNEBB_010751 [Seison nebaliae]|nr:hypothetical protein SNEBB_010751 [Seison nebaliae]
MLSHFISILVLFLPIYVSGTVVQLTADNFHREIQSAQVSMVKFYAPWCGHCKALAPKYDEAATILKTDKVDSPIKLFKVDCTVVESICTEFKVSGYPTLVTFNNGEQESYNGGREVNAIVSHMRAMLKSGIKEVSTKSEFENLLDSFDAIIAVNSLSENDYKLVNKIASKGTDGLTFVHLKNDEVAKEFGFNGKMKVWIQKNMITPLEDKSFIVDEITEDFLSQIVLSKFQGSVAIFDITNADKYSGRLCVVHYDIDYTKNTKSTNYVRNRVMKVSHLFPDVTFKIRKLENLEHLNQEYGLSLKTGDILAEFIDQNGLQYFMRTPYSPIGLKEFVQEVIGGKLKPYIKSKEIIPPASSGAQEVVGLNFDEYVTNSKRDVLIKFYAPWCGHCKSMAPAYDELADKLRDEDVDIVKYDATANRLPKGYDVKGFPTLIFVHGENREQVAYSGERTADAMFKYVAKMTEAELKAFDRKGQEKKADL